MSLRFLTKLSVLEALSKMVARLRSWLAPAWRKTCRYTIVLIGYGLFVGLQLGIARGICSMQIFLLLVALGAVMLIAFIARWPYVACIVWLVGSPYAKYFLEFKIAKGIPQITFDGVIIPGLAIALLLRAFRHRRKLGKIEFSEVLLVAFVAYAFVNRVLRWDMTLTQAKFFMYTMGLWPIVYYVFKSAVKTREQIVNIGIVMICAATFAACTFIYEAVAGKSFYSVYLGRDINLIWSDVKEGRSVGVFGSPVDPGHLLITASLLSMHFMGHTKKAFAKVVYVLCILSIVVGLYYTFTRNNYICFLTATLVMLFLARGRAKFYWVLVPMMIIGILGWSKVAMMDQDVAYRMTRNTLVNRAVFARTAFNVIRHHPWFGVGWQNGKDATIKYCVSLEQYEGLVTDMGQPRPTEVHSAYLMITQENGFVGAALYYGAVLMFLVSAFRLWEKVAAHGILGKDFVAVIIASSFAWLVSAITYESTASMYTNGVFLVMFALMVRLKLLEQCDADTSAKTELVDRPRLPKPLVTQTR